MTHFVKNSTHDRSKSAPYLLPRVGYLSRVILTGFFAFFAASSCSEGKNRDVLTDPHFAVNSAIDSLAPTYEMANPNRLPGRYIVRFKPTVTGVGPLSADLVRVQGGRVYQPLNSLKGFWGELPNAAIDALRRDPRIAYIEADVAVPIFGVGDTTQSGARWPLDRIDQRSLPLNNTYLYSTIGTGVRIWIIDTGVDRNAPELVGRIDETWSVTNNGKDPYGPCNNHGTLVATVAAGTTSGVAKGARIHSARVDADCTGTFSTGAASFAFEFIGDHSPRPAVINYSAGRECGFFGCGQTVDDAAKYARQRGVTVVVGAGNDGNNACDYSPAHTNELVTVAASNISDQRVVIPGWWSSNWGPCVDLFAPVENEGGTSLATPMVTGVAALYLQLYPSWTPSAVEAAILSSTTTGALGNVGSGSPNRLLYSPQPQLTINISGASTIGPFTNCTWSAIRSGGQPAYQYLWRRNGAVVSTGLSYNGGGFSNFDLSVEVTDGVGRSASSAMIVTVDPNNTDLVCTP
jgi:subtilisin family serine protease